MIIATFALGDTVFILSKRGKVGEDDADSHNLTATDLVTDKTYTKVYHGENDAVRAFCAAVAADEPDLSRDSKILYDDPAMIPFLP